MGLTLINERSSVGGKVNDGLLRDFPNSLVDRLELVGDGRDVLDRTTGTNDEVLHLVVP